VITIDRQLCSLLTYRTVFFPNSDSLDFSLEGASVVRFFWADVVWTGHTVISHSQGITSCIDLGSSPDSILHGMSQTLRRKLRHAEKLGARVRIVRNGTTCLTEFLAMFNYFAHRKDVGVAPIKIKTLLRYAPSSDVFLAYYDDELMCGHLNLLDTQLRRERLIFSANRRFDGAETAKLCAILNSYLHWFEIQAYRAEGLLTYDLGGLSFGDNVGIDQFKKSFGGTIRKEHTYLCAKSALNARLINLAEMMQRTARRTSGRVYNVLRRPECGWRGMTRHPTEARSMWQNELR
jgi:hypothetical protein